MDYGIFDGTKVIAKFAAPMSVISNHPTSLSDTLSLKRQTLRRSAQRWEISSNVEPLSFGAHQLFALLVMKGLSETLQIVTPQNYGAKQALTSTSTGNSTDGVTSANSTQVLIKNTSGTIPAGTFIKFNNHSKVYMLSSDSVSGSPLNIYPPLRADVPGDTGFKFKDDVMMTCYFDSDTIIGMSYIDGILMDNGALKFVEA